MNVAAFTVEEMEESVKQIEALSKQLSNYGNEVVQQRLKEDLTYLNEIISIHITQKKN